LFFLTMKKKKSDEDLLIKEFNQLWGSAPKFPQVEPPSNKVERIDVDSFIQIYRDIDDLFEDEEEDVVETSSSSSHNNLDDSQDAQEQQETSDPENELKIAFQNLCDSSSSTTNLISREDLRGWVDVDQLISDEGMLSEEEFNVLWDRTEKSKESAKQLDLNGFLKFNDALDDLFVFEDENDDDDVVNEDKTLSSLPSETVSTDNQMVVGENLTPEEIFLKLADKNSLVGRKDLERWEDLLTTINEGELLTTELDDMYATIPKAPGSEDKLNKEGFLALYKAIDDLFEDDDEEQQRISKKSDLFDYLAKSDQDDETLPCGLDNTEKEETEILQIVTELEKEKQNICLTKGGEIELADLAGEWDLIYTSSGMMKFNKGLTGLGGSIPNGEFAGLRQNLIVTKYITDVIHIERIKVTPNANSFDAVVNGNWELKSSINLFSGEPSTIMSIEPDKVVYGPTTTRADHWKSVRSMNLLDLSYLDNDLRVMRGNTSTDTLFIFKRCG